jgi:hypothetical protein
MTVRTLKKTGLVATVAFAMLGVSTTPALADAAPASAQATNAQQSTSVTSGELAWGVRASIRNYLENFAHTDGSVSAYNGATYKKGDAQAKFPVVSGTIDPQAGTADISFKGELDMRGFDEAWLDFENVRLHAESGRAQIIVDMKDSFNTKKRTDDLVLAEFDAPQSAFHAKDNTVTLSTKEGTFPAIIGTDYLPSYGGPTYSAPNDYTDGFDLTVQTKSAPAAPHGTSEGKGYSDNTAVMSVTPGYDLFNDKETTVTVSGKGFDSSQPIYLGFGAMADPSNPEAWRRSKGGFSGPGADYDYGAPRLVVAHGSPDGAVADGEMAKDGSWKLDVKLPGAKVKSFFGGEIDCLKAECGFFAFGAHGKVSAKNEAYTPVTFQNPEGTGGENPSPGEGGKKPGDGSGKPSEDPTPITIPNKKSAPFGQSTGKNPSGASVTVQPAYALKDKMQKVKLTGKSFPTSNAGSNFGGIYVLFGWVDQGKWRPSQGGRSGMNYTYIPDENKNGNPAGIFQRMVNYPGNNTEPDQPFMDKNGNWTMDFTIKASQFKSAHDRTIDCYQMQCGIITVGAHGRANADAEVFTPVYFTETAEQTGNKAPGALPKAELTANPNLNQPGNLGAAGNTGPLANTGFEPRMGMFAGLFILSLGVFTCALLTLRRRGGIASNNTPQSSTDASASL